MSEGGVVTGCTACCLYSRWYDYFEVVNRRLIVDFFAPLEICYSYSSEYVSTRFGGDGA